MKLVLSTSLMGIVILASAGTTMRPQYSGFFNGGSDGLSAAEVAERVARGLVNDVPSAPTRTIGQIVRANVLTRFNLLGVAAGRDPGRRAAPGRPVRARDRGQHPGRDRPGAAGQ